MILAIDIGNTTISFACVSQKRVQRLGVIDLVSKDKHINDLLYKAIREIKQKKKNISSAMICSVVPKLSTKVKNIINQELKVPGMIVGKDLQVPIKNNYRPKTSVGQDRLVGAYAASQIYGTPVIIIDLGTAITFDIVSKNATYEGGIIVPGICLSAQSLSKKTALLPHIEKIKTPHALIGKNTKESILSGLFHGYGAMCNGLIDQLKTKSLKKAKVIITGGHTHLMKKYVSRKIDTIDQNLVFKGLFLLHQDHLSEA